MLRSSSAAVLEHLARDESLLLVFAANASVAPETVTAALETASGAQVGTIRGMTEGSRAPRLGIDLGGTKIAGVALGTGDRVLAEHRAPAPRDDYAQTIAAIAAMVSHLEQVAGAAGSVGIGMPGSISPASGLVQNANSTWLNGQAVRARP